MFLNYDLKTTEERLDLVNKIVEESPDLSPEELDNLASYLLFCMDKEEKKSKLILTQNHSKTVSDRETSYEGLAEKFTAGEDALYDLIDTVNSKNTKFRPKRTITKRDIETVPGLKEVREYIELWERIKSHTSGRKAYIAKNAATEFRKFQYELKDAFMPPICAHQLWFQHHPIKLDCEESVKNGHITYSGFSLMNPKVVAQVLRNYSKLRQNDDLEADTWYFMDDFDRISSTALEDNDMLRRITELKIDGYQNKEIQAKLEEEFTTSPSQEYISSLWSRKIPNLIASAAEDEFLDWYYLEKEKGYYKTCTCCGKIKLGIEKYFSRNTSSKDGLYSICKSCRREKLKQNGQR